MNGPRMGGGPMPGFRDQQRGGPFNNRGGGGGHRQPFNNHQPDNFGGNNRGNFNPGYNQQQNFVGNNMNQAPQNFNVQDNHSGPGGFMQFQQPNQEFHNTNNSMQQQGGGMPSANFVPHDRAASNNSMPSQGGYNQQHQQPQTLMGLNSAPGAASGGFQSMNNAGNNANWSAPGVNPQQQQQQQNFNNTAPASNWANNQQQQNPAVMGGQQQQQTQWDSSNQQPMGAVGVAPVNQVQSPLAAGTQWAAGDSQQVSQQVQQPGGVASAPVNSLMPAIGDSQAQVPQQQQQGVCL